jgi:membrane fusion protein (multidrug efflux system)
VLGNQFAHLWDELIGDFHECLVGFLPPVAEPTVEVGVDSPGPPELSFPCLCADLADVFVLRLHPQDLLAASPAHRFEASKAKRRWGHTWKCRTISAGEEELTDDAQEARNLPPPRRRDKGTMRKWGFRVLVLVALVAAGVYLTPALIHHLTHESTDDAYVAGTVVPISAEVKGTVERVLVTDNQPVTAGDLLLEINRDDYAAYLEKAEKVLLGLAAEENQIRASIREGEEGLVEARANLASAEAQETFARKDRDRNTQLVKKDAVAQLRYDQVVSQWEIAKARADAAKASVSKAEAVIQNLEARLKTQGFRIAEAKAALDLAGINLARTQVRAPTTGRVAKKNVDPGKYVQPGQPLLALVESDVWVVANYKETQIEDLQAGQPVAIEVDAYPGVTFEGHIDSFQPGTGAVFSLLPPENATGNFVKIVQRVPVKIVLDSEPDPVHPLWPGMSVVPHVDTRANPRGRAEANRQEHAR